MTNKEIEVFSKFLEENGLTDKFVSNYSLEEDEYTYTDYLNGVSAERAVDSAFIWFKTPEDDKFWQDVDEEWQLCLVLELDKKMDRYSIVEG